MVKTKQRQNSNPSHLSGSSNSVIGLDGDDSWVVVKKQKITILVPPISIVTKSSTPNAEQSQLQPITEKVSNCQSGGALEETCLEVPAAVLPSASKNVKQQSSKSVAAHCNSTVKEPLKQAITPPNPDEVCNSRPCKVLGLLNSTKSLKQPRQLHCPGGFLTGGTLLNYRLRALNLERKLQKAGGISRWLESLGLDQFVGIFQRKSINKFQLVNLTMKKLKDMGANAVGPRRKLIHAIECVCQPYSSETFEPVYGI